MRERETDRERDRDRETETERQTERETEQINCRLHPERIEFPSWTEAKQLSR